MKEVGIRRKRSELSYDVQKKIMIKILKSSIFNKYK